ncbi:MAG: hypothetical protein EPO11_10690 [Gammaproteobacteria bacterium]|nr:MAG: hypothetical protein EPO11_10690 [Gammaproteobacteria bacterium]
MSWKKQFRFPFRKNFSRRINQSLSEFYNKHLHFSFFERLSLKIYIWHCLYQNLRFFYQKRDVIDGCLIKQLVHEIVQTGKFSLESIAFYVNVPVDIIVDISVGINTDPSLSLAGKIIDLYISAKKSYYQTLIKRLMRHFEIN